MSNLVEFWLQGDKNPDGYTLEDMLDMSDSQLERSHNFIQWMFPLDEPSRAQPKSPVLTEEDIITLRSGSNFDKLSFAMGVVCGRMLKFYGFSPARMDGDFRFILDNDFDQYASRWITPRNHNFLRLTRILKSLHLLGFSMYAEALQELLLKLADDPKYSRIIGPTTKEFWERAILEIEAKKIYKRDNGP